MNNDSQEEVKELEIIEVSDEEIDTDMRFIDWK